MSTHTLEWWKAHIATIDERLEGSDMARGEMVDARSPEAKFEDRLNDHAESLCLLRRDIGNNTDSYERLRVSFTDIEANIEHVEAGLLKRIETLERTLADAHKLAQLQNAVLNTLMDRVGALETAEETDDVSTD